MGRIQSSHRVALLRLSALGFAVLTGILAFGYFWLFEVLGSNTPALWSRDLRTIVLSFTLPAMPGAALSWWLLVVLPRRSSALAGGWAGLLTIVLAPLGVSVGLFATGVFSTAQTPPWQVIGWTFMFWLIGLFIVCATPQGWGMLLVGGLAGVLYGAFIGRGLPETPSGEAPSDADLRPDGSQGSRHRVERRAEGSRNVSIMAEVGEGNEGDTGEQREGADAVTDRVLRWLSAISLALLALAAVWIQGTSPSFAAHFPIARTLGSAYVLGYLLLPTTTMAVCDVTGIATLVVSLQRKQWNWFVGALFCLVFRFYSDLALYFPRGFAYLYRLAGSTFALSNLVALYGVLVFAPIVLLAFAYAWSRRQPPSASTAG